MINGWKAKKGRGEPASEAGLMNISSVEGEEEDKSPI